MGEYYIEVIKGDTRSFRLKLVRASSGGVLYRGE